MLEICCRGCVDAIKQHRPTEVYSLPPPRWPQRPNYIYIFSFQYVCPYRAENIMLIHRLNKHQAKGLHLYIDKLNGDGDRGIPNTTTTPATSLLCHLPTPPPYSDDGVLCDIRTDRQSAAVAAPWRMSTMIIINVSNMSELGFQCAAIFNKPR